MKECCKLWKERSDELAEKFKCCLTECPECNLPLPLPTKNPVQEYCKHEWVSDEVRRGNCPLCRLPIRPQPQGIKPIDTDEYGMCEAMRKDKGVKIVVEKLNEVIEKIRNS